MSTGTALTLVAVAAIAAAAALRYDHQQNNDHNDRCTGHRFAVETVRGGSAPYVQLTADGKRGAFLIDYGTTHSTLSALHFGNRTNGGSISQFDLPTFPAAQFSLAQYRLLRTPAGGQLGVIGTDFLSLLTVDFKYRPFHRSAVISGAVCDPDLLSRRKLVPIRQTGFFSSNPARLSPGRLNVPVVFLKIGPVMTWAQIDTGYDDVEQQPSIDINEALYAKLAAAGVKMESAGVMQVATCAGTESRSSYITPEVSVVTESGVNVRRLGRAHLVRKSNSSCGGIANMLEPAAQVAASLLATLREVVFDPRNETVWVAGEGVTADENRSQHNVPAR